MSKMKIGMWLRSSKQDIREENIVEFEDIVIEQYKMTQRKNRKGKQNQWAVKSIRQTNIRVIRIQGEERDG